MIVSRKLEGLGRTLWIFFDPWETELFPFFWSREISDILPFELWVRVSWKFISIASMLIWIPDILHLIKWNEQLPWEYFNGSAFHQESQ